MIESVTLPSIHTNGQYGKASDSLEKAVEKNNNNNNANLKSYRLKFPFHIKPVEPIINQNLLRDFTGRQFKPIVFYSAKEKWIYKKKSVHISYTLKEEHANLVNWN